MNPSGIQFRLLLLGIVPTLVIIASLAYYFIQYHYLDLENALNEKGRITINQLAVSSVSGVFSKNTETLTKIANTLLDETDIVSVQITDTLGNDLALSNHSPVPAKHQQLIYFQRPVTIQTIKQNTNRSINSSLEQLSVIPEKTIGTVVIALSLENTKKKQQSYLYNSLLLIITGITCTLILAIHLSRNISIPIINLTKTANDLAEGNMNARAKGSNTAEIDDLCQSFNTMANGLQKTHDHLMHQVNLAVDELTTTLANLEEKNKSLEKSTQLAITQNKTKSQFLAHISHEIRTPMNGVLGFIELLTKSKLSIQQQEQTQLIKTSASNLLTIVNEILDYSSLETGNFKINISTFNLRENIENCTTTIFPASNKVQLIVDIDNNIPNKISTDPVRLQQIITNLLGNACKFTHHGHILVRCRLLETGSLFISISDTGTGVHKDNIQNLFQIFLQTSEYTVNDKLGTGLGLTICKNIIKRLNGTLGVCSQYNTGSTFWFNLPVTLSETGQLAIRQQTIVVIDNFNLRKKALVKQLHYLGYRTQSFCSITEFDPQQTSSFELIFYGKQNQHYETKKILDKLREVTNNKPVIFLDSDKKPHTFSNFLALPCRSSFLKNLIESTTSTAQPFSGRLKENMPISAPSSSIFIADDNEINRLLLKSQLETHCKNITLASDGKIALSYLQKNKYDLILLDLQMPYFTGLELIKLIKQPDSINKDSPVIAITAHAQSQQRKILINAGFDECLIKPVLLEQLLEILGLWLPEENFSFNNEIESIDYAAIMLEKTYGNNELALNLFNKLFSELKEQSYAIEQALETNNLSVAEEITHKLHGSVSFCGFTDIQELAKAMEISLSSSDNQQIKANFLLLKNKITNFITLKQSILTQLVEG